MIMAMAYARSTRSKTPKKRECIIALFLVVLVGFAARLVLFSNSSYVSGDDGGYYVYYTQQLIDGHWTGSLLAPSPVIFFFSALFAIPVGVNAGVTIATCLFSSLAGLSVFLLSERLVKDPRASLIAATLTVFSALSLAMNADMRKSAAGAFFVPLVLYFLLKSFDDRKYLIPFGACGALAAMSHKTSFAAGFVLVAYFLLLFVFKKRLPKREVMLSICIAMFLLAVLIALFPNSIGELEWLSSSKADMNSGARNFSALMLPLAVLAPLGLAIGLRRRKEEDLFLAGWALSMFVLALPQVSSGQGYRFTYLLVAPLSILSGAGALWLRGKSKRLFYAAVAIAALSAAQFLYYGVADREMASVPSTEAMRALEELSSTLPNSAVVYSTVFRNGLPNYWINGYFFKRDDRPISVLNWQAYVNDDIEAGREVYVIQPGPHALFPWLPPGGPHLTYSNLETVYNKSDVLAFKVVGRIPESTAAGGGIVTKPYDRGRLVHLSTYLLLPYEVINAINPPYLPALQAFVGIPLSLLWASILMWLVCNKVKRLSAKQQRCLILIVSAFAIAAVLFKPGFL